AGGSTAASSNLQLSQVARFPATSVPTVLSSPAAGALPLSIVQSLLTSGRMSGVLVRSSSDGCQVGPRGGPNSAQLFRSFARAEVVNLASQEGRAAIGADMKTSKPQSAVILPLCFSYIRSQVMSRSEGWNPMFAGLPATDAVVSSRTCRSLVLLQPQ